jgi:hypothetical protein
MLQRRTLKILAGILGGYAVLSIPAWWGPAYLEAISGYVYIVPILSIYLFHSLGIPGLLEHNGLCGWGLCSPTPFGWTFLVLLWVGIAWLVARAVARLTSRLRGVRSEAPRSPHGGS